MAAPVTEKVGQVVLPGDVLLLPSFGREPDGALGLQLNSAAASARVVCGPGLRRRGGGETALLVSKCGLLRHKEPAVYWVQSQQKRVTEPEARGRGVAVWQLFAMGQIHGALQFRK
ncbi:hypothetical protein NDU88_000963 [Pleurodeles waltl]|uniref:Exosome complex component RRP40 N-terminal domain-containing protein n=1 Tax=Pleurodeles waltl TaxID=8319 RepID=A0AAV7VYG2_PLEWA|nr:hypothetical protein NDU88_000963 [Pleurodeles waltl]